MMSDTLTLTHTHHTNQSGVQLKRPDKKPKIFDVEHPRLLRALFCVGKNTAILGLRT